MGQSHQRRLSLAAVDSFLLAFGCSTLGVISGRLKS